MFKSQQVMTINILLVGVMILSFQNCSEYQFSQQEAPTLAAGLDNDTTIVCDPFGGGSTGTSTQGLAGNIRYFSPNLDHNFLYAQTAYDYLNHGTSTGVTIVMKSLNIPGRTFTEGFPMPGGDVLKDNDGNRLIEFFGIEFKGNIVLGPNDPEGPYTLAINSDDGTLVEIVTSNGYETLINNDGRHGMQQKEAVRSIAFTRNTVLPVRILYYQGPRNEIGLELKWKFNPAGGDFKVIPPESLKLPNGISGC